MPSIPRSDRSLESFNSVRRMRTEAGLSQHELGQRSGLSRQAVSAIEAGRYVPNTLVALRLARVLEKRVEELFALPEPEEDCTATLARGATRGTRQVSLARIGKRLVAHPLAGRRLTPDGFAPADGLMDEKTNRVRLLVDPARLERTALLFGCDPSLGILAAHMARRSPQATLHWLQASSRDALAAIAAGEAHAGGSHLPGAPGSASNLAQARKALKGAGGLIVGYAAWEQGLMVAKGNPMGLRSAPDLARRNVRFINREAGSGSRVLLDGLLQLAGMRSTDIAGADRFAAGHMDVARAIAAGSADAGIGLRAVAEACGLGFEGLAEVRFEIVIPRAHVEHPAIALMLEALQTGGLRRELEALPGYSAKHTGAIVADIPAA